MKNYLVDANIFLRFLLNDNPILSKKAQTYFEKAKIGECQLFCPQIIIFELVFVLDKVYDFDRKEIADKIRSLLLTSYISIENRDTFLQALKIYEKKNIDFVDVFLFSLKEEGNFEILSFDKDFLKLEKL